MREIREKASFRQEVQHCARASFPRANKELPSQKQPANNAFVRGITGISDLRAICRVLRAA